MKAIATVIKQVVGPQAWLIALAFFLVGCDGGGVKEIFSLAWGDVKGNVHVQYSNNGKSWTDANLPLNTETTVGPSLGADPAGVMYFLVNQNSSGDHSALFSLGPDGYMIANSEPLATSSTLPMDTMASIASVSIERWYLAYRNAQNIRITFVERKPDSTTGKPIYSFSDETPTLNINNTAVKGGPSIAIKATRVVASWYRQPSGGGELQISVGDIQSDGSIKWLGGQVFPNSESGSGGIELAHALCQNADKFYLGVLREDLPQSGPLKLFSLYVYQSVDGLKWSLRTKVGSKTPGLQWSFTDSSPIGLAVNSKGVIVAAQIGAGIRLWHYDKKWSEHPVSVSSGYPKTFSHFSLIASANN